MEQEIEKMSTVSLNTIYSKDILPGIRKIPVDQLGTQQTYTQVQAIYNSISAMIGPRRQLPRLISTTKMDFRQAPVSIHTTRRST